MQFCGLEKNGLPGNFPGGPGVKTSPFKAGDAGLIPGRGAKSHMPRSQKRKSKMQNNTMV